MVVVPEMTSSVVGVYNGKTFNQIEIKPEMIGYYLGEFSISYNMDIMAEESDAADMKKKRTFRKFTYRGVGLDQFLDMNHEQLIGAHVQEQEDVLPRAYINLLL